MHACEATDAPRLPVVVLADNLDKAQNLADKAYQNLVKYSTDEQTTLRIGKALKVVPFVMHF